MSLLGRLEDLSLADIIQIVYLSRRTGVLEILDDRGRHTVLFRHGLVVNASSPDTSELSSNDVEEIRRHIVAVIAPLLQSRMGEFSFLLADQLLAEDIGYDPDVVLREGGFPPQKILSIEGDKLKPLQEVAASMKAGKELLSQQRPGAGHFHVAGGLIEIESPESRYRNVILFEGDPMIRVAAKRAFGARGIKIVQFGAIDSAREAVLEFFRTTAFFITFLQASDDSAALLKHIKRKNPKLPVVMIDSEADLRRRHDLLHAGADLYLTKPAPGRLRPEIAEEELNLFAEELVLFADRAFSQLEVGGDPRGEADVHLLERFIDELSNPNDIREVTSTILRFAAEDLDRAILFSVTNDAFVGLGGFGPTGGGEEMDERARKLRISRSAPSVLSEVAASNESHRGKMQRTTANLRLIESLGGLLPTEVVALPIMHGDRTIGILYGDNAEHRTPIDSMSGLEIFLVQAGHAFGNAMAAERS